MKATIGIDEVGRGPIAGPVAVGAFRINKKLDLKNIKIPLRDSKKLSREQREIWFKQIKIWQKEGKCDFAVTMISAKEIDRIGIALAIKRALSRSIFRLSTLHFELVLLDGGLKAPIEFKNQKTIIKGDEKEPVISFASIVAKVTRDRYMFTQAKKYPMYGFENHVGYGTKAHYEAIKKYGMLDIHRKSFLKGIK
jgi:ribonuclease HII